MGPSQVSKPAQSLLQVMWMAWKDVKPRNLSLCIRMHDCQRVPVYHAKHLAGSGMMDEAGAAALRQVMLVLRDQRWCWKGG